MIVPGKSNRGTQVLHRFENGFGASVISDGYGKERGQFEIAVVEWDGDNYELTYQTPITSDVLGHLTADEVQETLDAIEALNPDAIAIEKAQRELADAEDVVNEARVALTAALEKLAAVKS